MMKKKLMSLALVALSLVSFTSMAQSTTDATCKNNKECSQQQKECKKERRCASPFAGLNLTADQQTKLQALNERQKEGRREAMQGRRENKQQLDSARFAERKAAKKAYLEEVKSIIGPDQYVVFLENFYINGAARPDGKAAFGKGKGHGDKGAFNKDKGGKRHGDKADRGARKDKRQDGSKKAAKQQKGFKTNA